MKPLPWPVISLPARGIITLICGTVCINGCTGSESSLPKSTAGLRWECHNQADPGVSSEEIQRLRVGMPVSEAEKQLEPHRPTYLEAPLLQYCATDRGYYGLLFDYVDDVRARSNLVLSAVLYYPPGTPPWQNKGRYILPLEKKGQVFVLRPESDPLLDDADTVIADAIQKLETAEIPAERAACEQRRKDAINLLKGAREEIKNTKTCVSAWEPTNATGSDVDK